MKKISFLILMVLFMATLAACGDTGENGQTEDGFDRSASISVYTRDTSSGTRDGFFSGIGFSAARSDDSVLVNGFVVAGNLTQVGAVQTDPYAIGYVSLSTLNTELFNGLSFDTFEPTIENVLSGDYKLARRFNYMLRDDYSVYGADAQAYEALSNAFLAYMGSSEGLASIAQAGGIVDVAAGQPWDTVKASHPICDADNSAYTLKIGGSDSVEAIATSISPDFAAKCGNVVPEHNHTGSSNAFRGTNGDASAPTDNLSIHVGFSSREFTANELAPGRIVGVVAIDAIVAITHLSNPLRNVSGFDLKQIYSGDITTWGQLLERQDFNGSITVYTRDTSSGTRDGFFSGIGFSAARSDDSVLADGFVVAGNLTQVGAVQTDPYAIGYVSLSTLNTELFNGLYFEGVAPTIENVLSGDYKLSRRFNYMLRDDYSVYGADAAAYEALSKAFVAYMSSTEGLASIAQAGGIVDVASGQPWDTVKAAHPVCNNDNSAYTLKIGGSDSVEALATSISPDFAAKCGNVVPEHNHTGSSNAFRGTNGDASAPTDNLSIHVGFSSREFTANELAPGRIVGVVAIDAIVAITHKDNPIISVSATVLKRIYAGEITNWNELS
ncbi:MAG: substrate-binding domain-containing protein [Acholeplasmataceae bacterium]